MNSQSLLSSSHTFLPEAPHRGSHDSSFPHLHLAPRTMLLGLPCARCRAYYAAGLHACPICGCAEKVPQVVLKETRAPQRN